MILRRGVRSGLSLLEVLVALAIFLFALVGIGQLMNLCSDQAFEIGNLNRAGQLLQSKMNEVVAGAVPISGQGDTAFDEDPNWSWSTESQAQTPAGLYLVTVTVTRKSPSGQTIGTWSLSQMVLDPTFRGVIEAPPTSSSSTTSNTMSSNTPTTGAGGP